MDDDGVDASSSADDLISGVIEDSSDCSSAVGVTARADEIGLGIDSNCVDLMSTAGVCVVTGDDEIGVDVAGVTGVVVSVRGSLSRMMLNLGGFLIHGATETLFILDNIRVDRRGISLRVIDVNIHPILILV